VAELKFQHRKLLFT